MHKEQPSPLSKIALLTFVGTLLSESCQGMLDALRSIRYGIKLGMNLLLCWPVANLRLHMVYQDFQDLKKA